MTKMRKEIHTYVFVNTNQLKGAQDAENSNVLKRKFQHSDTCLDFFAIRACLQYICTLATDCTNSGANRHYLNLLSSQPHG